MGLGNLLLLSQVTFYLLSFIISFFIFIPLTVNHNEFNGKCLLHAQGTWRPANQSGTNLKLDVIWGDAGQCNFGIFVGVVLFPMSLFYVLWMSVYLFKGTEPSWVSAFISLLVNVVMCLMLFVAALVVTSGFNTWCALLSTKISCTAADYIPFIPEKDIISGNFNIEFGMAEFGLWTCSVIWLLLLIMSSVQLYRYHNQENFFTSLYRERERLIQRINPNAQSSYSV